mmetsp:Transcript_109002/g.326013  ORF Transcript_109002/g.326013 Transcript_109002/m.326013 type:complete len:311 (-) Transcript_109002:92-1024(-)
MSGTRLCLLLLLLPSAARACSCGPWDSGLPVEYLQAPVIFTGEVVSVAPADCPSNDRASCAAPAGRELCSRAHIATVRVESGLKGIEDGSIYTYKCTMESCGDCSNPCPEVGYRMLDAPAPTGRSICSMRDCAMPHGRGFYGLNCSSLLAEVRRERSSHRRTLRLPLQIAHAPLQANSLVREDFQVAVVRDLLDALRQADSSLSGVSLFDVARVEVFEDGRASVRVRRPEAELAGTAVEVTLQLASAQDTDRAAALLLQTANAGPIALPAAEGVVRSWSCHRSPCPQCKSSCVDGEGFVLHRQGMTEVTA